MYTDIKKDTIIYHLQENGYNWRSQYRIKQARLTKTIITCFLSYVEVSREKDMKVKRGLFGMWKGKRGERGVCI
jgi:hypothetical protein